MRTVNDIDVGKVTIALVAPTLGILGGQGVQAHLLAERLCAEGFQVFFLPINPTFPRGLRWVRGVPFLRTILNQLLYLPSLSLLRRADIVHVFSASYWSFLLAPVPAIIASRMFGKRVVLHYHSGEAADHLANWTSPHSWLRKVDRIVVPSRYLQCVFASHGYPSRVIANVVDPCAFRFRDRRTFKPKLLSTRNLEPYYRVDNTIRAFSILKRRIPHATLTIVGYGSLEGKLKRLVSDLGVGNVRFLGRVEQESIPEVYDAADIFVNSSVVDNQPVSILEAFASGLSVVSTPTGDIRSLVRESETGYLVSTNDPSALATTLERALRSQEQTAGMAARARNELDQFSWHRLRREWMELYGGVLA